MPSSLKVVLFVGIEDFNLAGNPPRLEIGEDLLVELMPSHDQNHFLELVFEASNFQFLWIPFFDLDGSSTVRLHALVVFGDPGLVVVHHLSEHFFFIRTRILPLGNVVFLHFSLEQLDCFLVTQTYFLPFNHRCTRPSLVLALQRVEGFAFAGHNYQAEHVVPWQKLLLGRASRDFLPVDWIFNQRNIANPDFSSKTRLRLDGLELLVQDAGVYEHVGLGQDVPGGRDIEK